MEISELVIDPRVLGIGGTSSARATGLHASDLYNDFFADSNPKKYGYLSRENQAKGVNPVLVEPGLIFETMLEEGLRRRLATAGEPDGSIERPGELSHTDTFDGYTFTIHYNPDLFIFNGEFRVGEIKATWMWSGVTHDELELFKNGDADAAEKVRATLFDPKFEKYLCQLQLYMKMIGTRFGRLYIFFVNGCGRPPFPPQLLAWDLEFTQEELDMNYMMLVRHGISKGMISETLF